MRGVAKMANGQSILGTVVMDVLLSFNLAAIFYTSFGASDAVCRYRIRVLCGGGGNLEESVGSGCRLTVHIVYIYLLRSIRCRLEIQNQGLGGGGGI
jgi:hypothetical protein